MHRKRHLLVNLLSLWIVVSLLLTDVARVAASPPQFVEREPVQKSELALPAEQTSAGAPAAAVPASVAAATKTDHSLAPPAEIEADEPLSKGRLLLAPAIDLDGNPASNPVAGRPAPVIDLLGYTGGVIMLAAQLEPTDPNQAPIGVPVTFRLWNSGGQQIEQTVQSDAWGAASVEIPLADVASAYAYQASAPGYGQTETRRFRFDSAQVSHVLHADGAELSYQRSGNRLTLTLRSSTPLQPDRDEAFLSIMRRPAAAGDDLTPQPVDDLLQPAELPLPDLPMRIVDPYTAVAEIELPLGDYGIAGSLIVNGDRVEQFYSQPLRLRIETPAPAPAASALWVSPIEYEPGRLLVQYAAPDGAMVFGLAPSDQPPSLQEDWEGQSQLFKLWRTGPFEWQETIYDVQVETRLDDGKKQAKLQDFDYDPIARRYTIAIKSLHEETITDTLTVDIFGPGDIVIKQQQAQVVLEPGQILQYSVEVPAELGKPQGLRITLEDPLIEDFKQVEAAIRNLYAAVSVKGEFNSFFRLYADLFGVELIRYTFRYPPGSHEFKFELFEELMNNPWELLIRLGGSVLSSSRINIFGVLWDIFKGERDLDKLLDKLFVIDVGGLGADLGMEIGFSATADTGDCPEDTDIEDLKRRLQAIADRLDRLVADRVDFVSPTVFKIPLHAIVAVNIKIRLRLGGSVTANGLSIRATGQGSIGATGRLAITPGFSFGFGAYVIISRQIGNFISGLLVWVDVVRIIDEIINLRIPDGECDPDPPDPRPPDDRQDVWQGAEDFYRGETYEETIDNLSVLIQRSQERGLWRAERLFTLRLREAELARFTADRGQAIAYLDDSLAIMEVTDIDLQGILSGTIPISPTQTITEALAARTVQAWDAIYALPYPADLQRLQDALDVAQRLYLELQGQELELQRELRQLFTADAVGVVASGFAEATLSALDAAGLPAQLISPWPGNGEFRGRPAPYVAPELAPRAMVVPSGGLHAIAGSPGARDWLAAYAASGGVLVAFTQAFGSDWTALPGGQVTGVGYEEDQRWQHATVEAATPSNWLVWMGIAKPDIQVDGALTTWPEDATILLRRTRGAYAGYPAMIEYPFGEGSVLATSAYGDWAWQAGFWWGDDWQMTRSILNRAYLLARGQDVGDAFAADPASTVTVSFPITNTAAFTLTSVEVVLPIRLGYWGRDYSQQIPLTLPPGESDAVAATLSTPPVRRGVHDWTQVGIYRLNVAAKTVSGETYTVPGPFVYVRSPVVPPALSTAIAVENPWASLFQTVAVTTSVENFTEITRTVAISTQGDLPPTRITLNVPPRGVAEQAFSLFMDGSKSPAAAVYDEADKLVGRTSSHVRVAYPELRALPLIPDALFDGAVIPIAVTNRAQQAQALSASLSLTLTAPSGAVVWTDGLALPPIAAGQTVTPTFTLTTAAVELGAYSLAYRVDDGRGLARTSVTPIPSRLALNTTFDRPSYRIRESGVLTVALSNAGRFDLTPLLTLSAPDLGLDDSQLLDIPVAGSQTLVYGFDLSTALAAGSYPVTVSYQVGGDAISRNLVVVLPPAQVRPALDVLSYAAGDTISVNLSNSGGVDAPVAATLQLADSRGLLVAENAQTTTVLAGAAAQVSLTIPSGAATGAYQFLLSGENILTSAPLSLYENLDVSGVAAGLDVQTGQPTYFNDEPVQVLASVGVTSSSLENANLNLRICTPVVNPVTPPEEPPPEEPPEEPPPEPSAADSALQASPLALTPTQETRINYEAADVLIDWIDVSATGAVVAEGDDAYSLIDLGFPFQFYEDVYTQAYVGSNGYLSFGAGYTNYANSPIPSSSTPNNAIYALWDDLSPTGDAFGNVYAEQIDANRYVVQWQAVNHYGGGYPETFQIILDGADNTITLQYLDVSLTDFATVGVENPSGTLATQAAYSQPGLIVDGDAIRFIPFEEEFTPPAEAPFKSYLYTVGDVVFFSYADGSELGLFDSEGQPVWQGILDAGQRQLVNVPSGTYLASGSRKFAILGGDPIANGVGGYYASDQNGFGASLELYTWTQRSYFSPYERFIVFAYQDNTTVTVADADTGTIYWTGTLDNGQRWETSTLHSRWLHITADKPVSAYTYYDQGTLVPAADGRWSGTLFYTYAGLVGRWNNDVNVVSFEDGAQVSIQNSDTGEVYWSGALDSGQIHTEVFGGYTARGAAYLTISSDKTVAVIIAPFTSYTGAYHQGFYAPDSTGSRIGVDLIAPTLSGGVFQVFAYNDNTTVDVYDSRSDELINTIFLNAGESLNVNPGYGLWRLRSDKPVSAWSGWGTWSSEFAPVLFGSIVERPEYELGCGFVLWEEDVPVTTDATFDFDELVDPLEVTGRLILDGRLFANTGQLLDRDRYPFYLYDRNTALTVEVDRPVYRPGQSVYASGWVTNTSELTASMTLELSDGADTLLSQPLTLAPGQGYAYGAVFTATTPLTLTATASNAAANVEVLVADPQAAAELIAPDVVGRAPFSVTLVLTNTGLVTAALQTTLIGQPGPALVLQPGEVAQVVRPAQTFEDAELTATVGGDVSIELAKFVQQGELAALSLSPPATDLAGPMEVPFLVDGVGLLAASGQLAVELDGLPLAVQPFAVLAGQSTPGLLPIVAPAGRHRLVGKLVDKFGNLMDQAELELVLSAPAQPAVPDVRLIDLTISPTPVAAGQSLTATLQLVNDGEAGPIVVGLQLFDPEQQHIITPTRFLTESLAVSLDVPADLPSDQYFGEVIVDDQSQPFTVDVVGLDVAMSLALDRPYYVAGDPAELTVTLTEQAGVTADYIIMSRYLSAEGYYTTTVPAHETIQYTFPFTATDPGRVTVFLSNAPTPEVGQRVLTLDSLPVPVAFPGQGAYLTHDKLVYDPGETVHMTVTITGTLANVIVMGPMELAYRDDGFLLWQAPLSDEGAGPVLPGEYALTYALPAAVREGRYTFLLRADGQVYDYPIDVRGWKVTTRHITLDKPRYAQEDDISAVVEFWNEGQTPLTGLRLTAWVFTPDDGPVLELSPPVSRTVDLQPGLNVFRVSGAFTTPVVGAHRLLVNVSIPGAGVRVAGAVAQFDVGWANLVALTTDRGAYEPNQPGSGRLDVYGFGPAQLTVTASDGSTLLAEPADLAGFKTYTFTIPTAEIDDYLLVAQSIDQNGAADQLLRAYAVPGPADLQSPTLTLTYPTTNTVITSSAAATPITVTGQATDNSGQVTVLVNGQVVTPTAAGDFSLPLELVQGLNLVSVVVLDAAGNLAFGPIIRVTVVPERNITLTADRDQASVGQPFIYTVVLTATGAITDVVMTDLLPAGVLTSPVASANVGQVSVNERGVTWIGPVRPDQPALITMQVTPLVTGTLTDTATALWGYGLVQESNEAVVEVAPADDEPCFECKGGVTELTLRYTAAAAALVQVYEGHDPRPEKLLFENVVAPNGLFTFRGIRSDYTMSSEITLFVDGVEQVRIHTSCSQLIGPGLIAGDFEVASGQSKDGGLLCPLFGECNAAAAGQLEIGGHTVKWSITNAGGDPLVVKSLALSWPESNGALKKVKLDGDIYKQELPPPSAVIDGGWYGDLDNRMIEPGKTRKLELEFVNDASAYQQGYGIQVEFLGQGCILDLAIPPDLCAECEGGVTELTLRYTAAAAALVQVYEGHDPRPEKLLFENVVAPNGLFTFRGIRSDYTMSSEITLFVDGTEQVRIHTSCSQLIGPGLIAGDFEVASGQSKDGGLLCPLFGECNAAAAGQLEIGGHTVKWSITNAGGDPLVVKSLALSWPESNGALKKVKLDGDIYKQELPPPSAVIDGGWYGDLDSRMIEPGETRKLELEFVEYADLSQDGYGIQVEFLGQGCILDFVPGPGGGEFTCSKPLDALTMIWDGAQPVRIMAWKGAVGSTLLADVDNIALGQEVTVSGFAGSPNDVYWEVFQAGSDSKIGASAFHLSCSDDDMDGAEDCGKRQGNGKSNDLSLINDWLLEGIVDSVSTLDCTP